MNAIDKNSTLCVIFSKDRPMQLDATLSSLFLHCEDVENTTINVLFTSSSEKVKNQYQQLISLYKDVVVFTEEMDFQNDLLNIIYSFSFSDYSRNRRIVKLIYRLISFSINQSGKILNKLVNIILFPAARFFTPIPNKHKYILFK